MAKTQRELLITWLNDVYATERAQEEMLKRLLDNFAGQQLMQDELKRHLDETKQQAADVATAIDRLGGKVSTSKSGLGALTGALRGAQGKAFHNEQVRGLLTLHAGKHFEHAAYAALAAAARELEENDIADMCDRIAEEEQSAAEWTLDVIPDVVRATILDQEPPQR